MPALHLHNGLTRRREAFRPVDPDHVRMYVCGPTVYDLAHLGNACPVVVFDVLARLLRHDQSPGRALRAGRWIHTRGGPRPPMGGFDLWTGEGPTAPFWG